jgi:nucleoside-diphosphate-sugar epimerase
LIQQLLATHDWWIATQTFMRILVIGGTGFIGPPLVRQLSFQGHKVAVLHRGRSGTLPAGITAVRGDRRDLAALGGALRSFGPDVVVDLILSSAPQAQELIGAFRGIAGRVVAISSIDVYRASGVLHGSEPGPLQPVPLTEDSELRSRPPYSPEQLKGMQSIFSWVDDAYDKVPVERVVMSDPKLPGTVLRLPAVYGPGDRLHRLFPILKRIDDGRKTILFASDFACWRWSRGYVDNMAAAIALATTSGRAAGRIYNVAEEPPLSERDWTEKVAQQAGWRGALVELPAGRVPSHLRFPGNPAQDWAASSQRIREDLGYREVVPFEEGLRRTIAWERANPPLIHPSQFDYDAEDAALAA